MKNWKFILTFFITFSIAALFLAPAALADSPDTVPNRPLRQVVQLIKISAETIGLTPQELIQELRAAEDRTIAAVATEYGVDPNAIIEAAVAKTSERLDGAIENGRLTREEADQRLESLRERVTEAINTPPPDRLRFAFRALRFLVRTAADEIGLTPRKLLDELRETPDRSIADVASEYGADPNEIVNAAVAKVSERLDQAVENNRLGREDADRRLATATERISKAVYAPFPLPPKRNNQN